MPDYLVKIEVKDVAVGDVATLVEQISQEHGDDFDAALGDFKVSVSEKVGDRYYTINLEDEDA